MSLYSLKSFTTKIMRQRIGLMRCLALCLGVLTWGDACAQLAIIVHPESRVNEISLNELVDLFLGKTRYLAKGEQVVPIDQLEGSPTRDEFYKKVIKKTGPQLNSYWSRMIFSGKGRPPYSVADDEEVLELISVNRNMIGYVALERVTASVKVILVID